MQHVYLPDTVLAYVTRSSETKRFYRTGPK